MADPDYAYYKPRTKNSPPRELYVGIGDTLPSQHDPAVQRLRFGDVARRPNAYYIGGKGSGRPMRIRSGQVISSADALPLLAGAVPAPDPDAEVAALRAQLEAAKLATRGEQEAKVKEQQARIAAEARAKTAEARVAALVDSSTSDTSNIGSDVTDDEELRGHVKRKISREEARKRRRQSRQQERDAVHQEKEQQKLAVIKRRQRQLRDARKRKLERENDRRTQLGERPIVYRERNYEEDITAVEHPDHASVYHLEDRVEPEGDDDARVLRFVEKPIRTTAITANLGLTITAYAPEVRDLDELFATRPLADMGEAVSNFVNVQDTPLKPHMKIQVVMHSPSLDLWKTPVFHSRVGIIVQPNNIERVGEFLDEAHEHFVGIVDQHQDGGSDWNLVDIIFVSFAFDKTNLGADGDNSFPMPTGLATNVVNIKTTRNECLISSILATFNPDEPNASRASVYQTHTERVEQEDEDGKRRVFLRLEREYFTALPDGVNELDITGVTAPSDPNAVRTIEANNDWLSINLFQYLPPKDEARGHQKGENVIMPCLPTRNPGRAATANVVRVFRARTDIDDSDCDELCSEVEPNEDGVEQQQTDDEDKAWDMQRQEEEEEEAWSMQYEAFMQNRRKVAKKYGITLDQILSYQEDFEDSNEDWKKKWKPILDEAEGWPGDPQAPCSEIKRHRDEGGSVDLFDTSAEEEEEEGEGDTDDSIIDDDGESDDDGEFNHGAFFIQQQLDQQQPEEEEKAEEEEGAEEEEAEVMEAGKGDVEMRDTSFEANTCLACRKSFESDAELTHHSKRCLSRHKQQHRPSHIVCARNLRALVKSARSGHICPGCLSTFKSGQELEFHIMRCVSRKGSIPFTVSMSPKAKLEWERTMVWRLVRHFLSGKYDFETTPKLVDGARRCHAHCVETGGQCIRAAVDFGDGESLCHIHWLEYEQSKYSGEAFTMVEAPEIYCHGLVNRLHPTEYALTYVMPKIAHELHPRCQALEQPGVQCNAISREGCDTCTRHEAAPRWHAPLQPFHPRTPRCVQGRGMRVVFYRKADGRVDYREVERPEVYHGDDAAQHFIKRSLEVADLVYEYLQKWRQRDVDKIMRPEDEEIVAMSTHCIFSQEPLTDGATRDHDHVLGQFRGMANRVENMSARVRYSIPMWSFCGTRFEHALISGGVAADVSVLTPLDETVATNDDGSDDGSDDVTSPSFRPRHVLLQPSKELRDRVRQSIEELKGKRQASRTLDVKRKLKSQIDGLYRLQHGLRFGPALQRVLDRYVYRKKDHLGNSIGRVYGGLLQSVPGDIRKALAGPFYHDVDMTCSFQRILIALVSRETAPSVWRYVEEREDILKGVALHYSVDRKAAKQLFNSLTNGGTERGWRHEREIDADEAVVSTHDFVCEYGEEITEQVIPKLLDAFPDINATTFYHKRTREVRTGRDHDNTALAYILQSCEVVVLRCIEEFFTQQGFNVGTLIHDGMLIAHNDKQEITRELFDDCAVFVKRATEEHPPGLISERDWHGYSHTRLEEKEFYRGGGAPDMRCGDASWNMKALGETRESFKQIVLSKTRFDILDKARCAATLKSGVRCSHPAVFDDEHLCKGHKQQMAQCEQYEAAVHPNPEGAVVYCQHLINPRQGAPRQCDKLATRETADGRPVCAAHKKSTSLHPSPAEGLPRCQMCRGEGQCKHPASNLDEIEDGATPMCADHREKHQAAEQRRTDPITMHASADQGGRVLASKMVQHAPWAPTCVSVELKDFARFQSPGASLESVFAGGIPKEVQEHYTDDNVTEPLPQHLHDALVKSQPLIWQTTRADWKGAIENPKFYRGFSVSDLAVLTAEEMETLEAVSRASAEAQCRLEFELKCRKQTFPYELGKEWKTWTKPPTDEQFNSLLKYSMPKAALLKVFRALWTVIGDRLWRVEGRSCTGLDMTLMYVTLDVDMLAESIEQYRDGLMADGEPDLYDVTGVGLAQKTLLKSMQKEARETLLDHPPTHIATTVQLEDGSRHTGVPMAGWRYANFPGMPPVPRAQPDIVDDDAQQGAVVEYDASKPLSIVNTADWQRYSMTQQMPYAYECDDVHSTAAFTHIQHQNAFEWLKSDAAGGIAVTPHPWSQMNMPGMPTVSLGNGHQVGPYDESRDTKVTLSLDFNSLYPSSCSRSLPTEMITRYTNFAAGLEAQDEVEFLESWLSVQKEEGVRQDPKALNSLKEARAKVHDLTEPAWITDVTLQAERVKHITERDDDILGPLNSVDDESVCYFMEVDVAPMCQACLDAGKDDFNPECMACCKIQDLLSVCPPLCRPREITTADMGEIDQEILAKTMGTAKLKPHSRGRLLCATVEKQFNMVRHERYIGLLLKLGYKVTKSHRMLPFRQAPVMHKTLTDRAKKRAAATSTAESERIKIWQNSMLGGFGTDVTKQVDTRIFTTNEYGDRDVGAELRSLITDDRFKGGTAFTPDLAAISMAKKKVTYTSVYFPFLACYDLSKTVFFYWLFMVCIPYWTTDDGLVLVVVHATDTDAFYLTFTEKFGRTVLGFIEQSHQYMDLSNFPLGSVFNPRDLSVADDAPKNVRYPRMAHKKQFLKMKIEWIILDGRYNKPKDKSCSGYEPQDVAMNYEHHPLEPNEGVMAASVLTLKGVTRAIRKDITHEQRVVQSDDVLHFIAGRDPPSASGNDVSMGRVDYTTERLAGKYSAFQLRSRAGLMGFEKYRKSQGNGHNGGKVITQRCTAKTGEPLRPEHFSTLPIGHRNALNGAKRGSTPDISESESESD